jgi:hypothetical protein
VTTAAIMLAAILGGEVPAANLDGWTWEENTVASRSDLVLFPTTAAVAVEAVAEVAAAAAAKVPSGPSRIQERLDARLDEVARLFDQARTRKVRTESASTSSTVGSRRRTPRRSSRADREARSATPSFCEAQRKMVLSSDPKRRWSRR